MNRFFRENNIFDAPKNAGKGRAKSLPTPGSSVISPVRPRDFDSVPLFPGRVLRPTAVKPVAEPECKKLAVNRRDGYFVPPEFGKKFENLPAYSHRLEFKQERDLRIHFMSDLERSLMKALLKFSTNYIMGYVSSRDMRMTGNKPVKYKKALEHTSESRCTVCNYRFKDDTRVWYLYAVVRIEKPLHDPNRVEICCQKCYLAVNDPKNSYEIYPSINLADIKYLARERFFYQYIFPVTLDHTKEVKELKINDHNCKVFEIIRGIIRNHKEPNERIQAIELSTTGGLVLKETYTNIVLRRYRSMSARPQVADDVNCFFLQEPSEMMEALKDNRFSGIKGTVFATVRVKKFTQVLDGAITFPLKPSPNSYCKLCKKTKLYYKNPVLYCTKCGFTNVYHFREYAYYFECIKSFEMHNEMIIYYDLKLYKKLSNIDNK
ncbi:me53 protein [Thysanoplusia orichalcea nucleopolyhedrovirus]|uniref:Me53 protein n=1 Tax=Thysanoplusia orichalcea nucleopolyhedrovirus TaxID=101850 RepID=L0CK59_9ABAC|nr:me53 protein [Thysanoplusia orichalcea nucleopolyhedrovirus]AGA16287.1 me53 protein [Thysanoplusia orichalcea nucleopolyhedrovirus]